MATMDVFPAEGVDQGGEDRRGFLKRAVLVTGGVVVGSKTAAASDRHPKTGRLPMNTPITKLGLSAEEANMLTAAAKKATKADLFTIQQWIGSGSKGKPPAGLTTADVSSIGKAFEAEKTRQHDAAAMGDCTGSCCCCCCTPCCCCASAVVEPIQ